MVSLSWRPASHLSLVLIRAALLALRTPFGLAPLGFSPYKVQELFLSAFTLVIIEDYHSASSLRQKHMAMGQRFLINFQVLRKISQPFLTPLKYIKVKQITEKNVLYSKGKSAQYSTMTYMGTEPKQELSC